MRLPLVLATALTAACTGLIGEPAADSRDERPPGIAPTPSACVEGLVQAGPSPLRRLTQRQYENSVRALFGAAIPVGAPLAGAVPIGVYRTNADANTVSSATAELLFAESAAIAAAALASPTFIAPCDVDAEPSVADACIEQALRAFGARVYRRPLREGADGEYEALVELYRLLRTQEDVRAALQGVVETLLQSPQFLYLGDDAAEVTSEGVERLDDYTIASRLSYFLWDSMPDDELFARAAAGGLSRPEDIAAQAERMLADPRARDVVQAFHEDWLLLAAPDAIVRDPATYPTFDAQLARDLYAETSRFIDHVWRGEGRLSTLLTDRTVLANPSVEAFYGLPAQASSATDWREAQLPDGERRGVLTRAAFLMNRAHVAASAPIQRGTFVMRQLLCLNIRLPDDVNPTIPEDEGPTDTIRAKLARHRTDPRCDSCHSVIDPLGLSFEHYDATGAFRSHYANGVAVAASGSYEERPFADALGLLDGLAGDPDVHACYARGWFSYAMGRGAGTGDRCSLERAAGTFVQADGDLRQLILALVQSDAFRYREAPTLEEP